jgi:hypothetical protein
MIMIHGYYLISITHHPSLTAIMSGKVSGARSSKENVVVVGILLVLLAVVEARSMVLLHCGSNQQ